MRKSAKVVISLAGIGLVALSGLAFAGKEGNGPGGKAGSREHRKHIARMFFQRFAEMDTNHDKKVSREEFSTAMMKRFERVDANRDGSVTPAEITDAIKEYGKSVFTRLDKNGDGKIGKDEFPGKIERFTLLDTNGDGFVTKEELEAAGKKVGKRFADMKSGQRIWEKADTNKDGKISRDEYAAAVNRAFDVLDRNDDGVLSEGDRKLQSPRDREEDDSVSSGGKWTSPALP